MKKMALFYSTLLLGLGVVGYFSIESITQEEAVIFGMVGIGITALFFGKDE